MLTRTTSDFQSHSRESLWVAIDRARSDNKTQLPQGTAVGPVGQETDPENRNHERLKHYQILAEFLDARNLPREPLAIKTLDAAGPVPLQARGLLASRSLLAWVWDPRSQHGRPVPEPVQGARLRVRGLRQGSYPVQFVDPWSGSLLGCRTLQCAADDGPLELPVFTRDVAIRVVPANAAKAQDR